MGIEVFAKKMEHQEHAIDLLQEKCDQCLRNTLYDNDDDDIGGIGQEMNEVVLAECARLEKDAISLQVSDAISQHTTFTGEHPSIVDLKQDLRNEIENLRSSLSRVADVCKCETEVVRGLVQDMDSLVKEVKDTMDF